LGSHWEVFYNYAGNVLAVCESGVVLEANNFSAFLLSLETLFECSQCSATSVQRRDSRLKGRLYPSGIPSGHNVSMQKNALA